MSFLKAIIKFLKWIFVPKPPPRCAVCGRLVKDGKKLWCGNCLYLPCERIVYNQQQHKFAGAVAGAVYFEDMKKAVWRIKKTPDKRTLQYLATLMQGAMEESLGEAGYDVIVPVPISREKRRERGFNQAEKLACALSEIIGVPVEADALIRHDDSQVQHTLDKQSRLQNAAKSYAATDSDCVKGKTVLLVDDLYTTGATASSCANRLLEMGAARVYVAAAAWTPPRQPQAGTPPSLSG